MPPMTATAAVLHLRSAGTGGAWYDQPGRRQHNLPDVQVRLHPEDYAALGEPETITVRITPGADLEDGGA